MFFCEECREKNGWPDSMLRSRGRCEVCGEEAHCNDVPSSQLPRPQPGPLVQGDLRRVSDRHCDNCQGSIGSIACFTHVSGLSFCSERCLNAKVIDPQPVLEQPEPASLQAGRAFEERKETLERVARLKAEILVHHVLSLHGVKLHRFRDGTFGILDVPGKWASVIRCLHESLLAALTGEELPRFKVEEPPPRPSRKQRCDIRKDGRRCTKAYKHDGIEHADVRGNVWVG